MDVKLIYIPNDNKQEYPFCVLKSLVEPANKIYLKSPTILTKRMRENVFKALGTTIIYSQISPPSLITRIEYICTSIVFMFI